MTVASELARYGLYLVGVQDVRWVKGAVNEQRIIPLPKEK